MWNKELLVLAGSFDRIENQARNRRRIVIGGKELVVTLVLRRTSTSDFSRPTNWLRKATYATQLAQKSSAAGFSAT